MIFCWCELLRFPCSAVRIYDGRNIGCNFVKCYECCVPLRIPALITKTLSPDGVYTRMDALYSVMIPLHCCNELFSISRVPHGFKLYLEFNTEPDEWYTVWALATTEFTHPVIQITCDVILDEKTQSSSNMGNCICSYQEEKVGWWYVTFTVTKYKILSKAPRKEVPLPSGH